MENKEKNFERELEKKLKNGRRKVKKSVKGLESRPNMFSR